MKLRDYRREYADANKEVENEVSDEILTNPSEDCAQDIESSDQSSSDKLSDRNQSTVNDIADKIETVISTIDKVRKFSWRDLANGFMKIIFLIACIIVISFGWYGVTHTEEIIKYYIEQENTIRTEQHDKRFYQRLEKSKTINLQLKNMYEETIDVDRIYIIEFHNGSSNLADLPFCYGSTTYEFYSNTELTGSKDHWSNIENIQLGNLFNEVCSKAKWIGSVDDVRRIDNKFYHKLASSDVEHIGMVALYNSFGKPIGVVGIETTKVKVTEAEANKNMKVLLKYSQIISSELANED